MPLANKTKRLPVEEIPLLLSAIGRDRDQQAYKRVFYFYYQDLVRYSFSIVRDYSIAEDVVAEVLLKLWLLEGKAMEIQNLSFYLFRAVKNSSLNELTKLQRQDSLDQNYEVMDPQNPEQLTISKEFVANIEHAIELLPPKCKTVFLLVREQQLSYAEAADLLGISINTVNRHVQLALSKLYELINKK